MAKYTIINSIVSGSYNNCVSANGYVELNVGNIETTRYTCGYIGAGTVYGIRLSPSLAAIIEPPASGRRYVYYMLVIVDREYSNRFYAYLNNSVGGIAGGEQLGEIVIDAKTYRAGAIGAQYLTNVAVTINNLTGGFAEATETVDSESELNNLLDNLGIRPISGTYPITYSYTNSTVSGPSEAAVGETVTVSAVPNGGYGITDASTQILVTNNDVAVPYTWDAATNHITFTMPDPSN